MRDRLTQMMRTGLVQAARLLIATDFDGTLAPIVPRPDQARPLANVMTHVQIAARLRQTSVAFVSGRSLHALRQFVGPVEGAWWVGGHGAELVGPRHVAQTTIVPQNVETLLRQIGEAAERMAPVEEGFLHEQKPMSVAVHYREVEEKRAAEAVMRLVQWGKDQPGVHLVSGKMVIELMAVKADKGTALRALKHLTGATAIVYLGDDQTDEDAFDALTDADVGIKIGGHPTAADVCVETLEEAHGILRDLIEARQEWISRGRRHAMQDYSVLSDQRTMAVVSPDAKVEWLCLPRIDSGSVFSSLLDGDAMGTWSVVPVGDDGKVRPQQRYRGDTFTLETTWPTIRVIDYLDGSAGRTFQRAGRTDLVRVLEGTGRARVVFAPRLDFGRARTKLVLADGGIIVEGAADPLVLSAPGVQWTLQDSQGHQTAIAEVDVSAGPVAMELRAGTRLLVPARVPEVVRREQSERMWSQWAASLRLPRIATQACKRSALVLRALSYGPTGAVLAAGTTSLPETAGGERNWDYRFCWPRDAAVAGAALVRVGNTGVAMKYLDWLLGIVDRCAGPERLRPIYTVTGEELGSEAELSHLGGHRQSQPVRIGNAAARQVQIDVFGPIVELLYLLAEAGAAISPDHWRLVEAMATAVERSWQEPDHGIWEVRMDKRHHVHSKVMCWVALDRAIRLADQFVGVRREGWLTLRERIREDVLGNGFDATRGGFVAAYGHGVADASALTVGLSGLVEQRDPRFVGTVELVQRELLDGGTVYRYTFDDEIPGPEGGFHLCTGWLVEALALIGRMDEARALFERLCAAAGETGIMSEQWCPMERTGLGNLPQAYSHAAIINAAVTLQMLEDRG